jgi:UDP-sugar pyrophosphorylase
MKYGNGKLLPLCIMVSNDTKVPTIELLKSNKSFGLKKEQLFLVEQGAGVPALSDNDSKFSMSDSYTVSTKPHGHGDIHALLYRDGIVRKWKEDFDINYIVLFQVSRIEVT